MDEQRIEHKQAEYKRIAVSLEDHKVLRQLAANNGITIKKAVTLILDRLKLR